MDNSLIFFPFYIGDWLKETRHMSMVERAAYIELTAWYICKDGNLPPDEKQIFRICGAETKSDQKAVCKILSEYFPQSENFQNKSLNDFISQKKTESKTNSQNGKRGGLAKANKLKTIETGLANAMQSPEPSLSETLAIQRQRQETESKTKTEVSKDIYSADFEKWWEEYPPDRKVGKKQAQQKWNLILKTQEATSEELIRAVIDYRQSSTVRQGYACQPVKWLNQQYWAKDWGVEPMRQSDARPKGFDAVMAGTLAAMRGDGDVF